jgi:hypothetical protein
MPNV